MSSRSLMSRRATPLDATENPAKPGALHLMRRCQRLLGRRWAGYLYVIGARPAEPCLKTLEVTRERGAHLVLVALLLHDRQVQRSIAISSLPRRACERNVNAARPPSASVGTTVRKR